MKKEFTNVMNGSKAASVEPRKNGKKSCLQTSKRGKPAWLRRAVDAWIYCHRGDVEYDWIYAGRTWWLKYQRYLREVKGLEHVRLSGKRVVSVEPWFEVKLEDGTSKFINGCCSYESYKYNIEEGNFTGYLDTYEDPCIKRVASKTARKAKKA